VTFRPGWVCLAAYIVNDWTSPNREDQGFKVDLGRLWLEVETVHSHRAMGQLDRSSGEESCIRGA
jgi:hypothetical protein